MFGVFPLCLPHMKQGRRSLRISGLRYKDADTDRTAPVRGSVRHFSGNATNPADLCPIYSDGAATYSRPHTIILHNEDGDCKSFCETWPLPDREPARCGFEALPRKTESDEKECVFIGS